MPEMHAQPIGSHKQLINIPQRLGSRMRAGWCKAPAAARNLRTVFGDIAIELAGVLYQLLQHPRNTLVQSA